MSTTLETFFKAADNHAAKTGESIHAIGDLQDLLREAWSVLIPSQKLEIIGSAAAANVLESGSLLGVSPSSLEAEIHTDLQAKEVEIKKAGYEVFEGENGFYWELEEESLSDEKMPTIWDAIDSAHKHLMQPRKPKMKP